MTGQTRKLIISPPPRDAPGFMRRQRKMLELHQLVTSQSREPALVDAMVEMILPYVSVPSDRDEAREALLDASEDEFYQIMRAIEGGGADPNSPSGGAKSGLQSEAQAQRRQKR